MSRPADSRTFLEQMGIDVWVTRCPADAPSAEMHRDSAPAESVLAEPESVPVVPARGASEPVPGLAAPVARRAGDTGAPVAPVTSTTPVAPFRVLSLQKGPALVLFEPGEGKASHRFVSDILSAASGIWGGDIAALAFEWPQPGIDNDVETQRKALGAFVAKQIDDQVREASDSLIVVAREVADRLSQVPVGCVLLPHLAALMVQADLKRALWAELESRVRSPNKNR